ncbi:MAG: 5-(carboxyamino)imidazole ribonucleotide mutase [Elusimicrobiota bacterium]|nr:5-(carboxyamino)imidazole ribonucleotide mutase [Elusimicrobiota bacterium]
MKNKKNPLVGIIMGSDSDLNAMKEAEEILKFFGIPYELDIVSAHRTPQKMFNYAKTAHKRGLKVIIAGAGGAAHLPGMVASITPLPVIGVPIKTTALQGLDSLLSIVQMPAGVPVATVAIDNAKNAAILAVEILGTYDDKIRQKVIKYKSSLFKTVQEKSKKVRKVFI